MPERSRSPHGERGLKFAVTSTLNNQVFGRSPHGERGLKLLLLLLLQSLGQSLPTRGAWIEIWIAPRKSNRQSVAPHTGSVD